MGTTPNRALPWPEGNKVPYVHQDIKALAEATDDALGDLYVDEPSTAAPAHKAGLRWFQNDTGDVVVSTGTVWRRLTGVIQDWTAAEAWAAAYVNGSTNPPRRAHVKRVDDLVFVEAYIIRDDSAAIAAGDAGIAFRVPTIFRPSTTRYMAVVSWVNGNPTSRQGNAAASMATDGNLSLHLLANSTGVNISAFYRI